MTRDELGRVAREAWIAWAHEQLNPKESWLAPWEELPEVDREADRRIGEAVRAAVIAAEFGPHVSVVATAYLRDLEALARATDAYFPAGQRATTPLGPMQEALIRVRAYPDWQRKGEPS